MTAEVSCQIISGGAILDTILSFFIEDYNANRRVDSLTAQICPKAIITTRGIFRTQDCLQSDSYFNVIELL